MANKMDVFKSEVIERTTRKIYHNTTASNVEGNTHNHWNNNLLLFG